MVLPALATSRTSRSITPSQAMTATARRASGTLAIMVVMMTVGARSRKVARR